MRILVVEEGSEDIKETQKLLERLGISSSDITEQQTKDGPVKKIIKKDHPEMMILTAPSFHSDLVQQISAATETQSQEKEQDQNLLQHCTPYQPAKYKKRFLIKQGSKLHSFRTENIAFFYSKNRLNYLKAWDNRSFIINYTMEDLVAILPPQDFFRISRSHIISYKSVAEVHTHFHSRLKLKLHVESDEEIFVSKEKVAEFKKWIGG